MSLNDSSPVSAFAVYKMQSNLKQKKKYKDKPVTASSVSKFNKDLNNTPPNKKVKVNKNNKKMSLQNHENIKVHENANNKTKKVHRSVIKKTKLKLKKYVRAPIDDELPVLVPIEGFTGAKRNKSTEEIKPSRLNSENICITDQSKESNVTELLSELNKTDPSPEGLKLFKWLIAPLNPKVFFGKYWERDILFIERNSKGYYSHVLTTQRLDDIFREYPLYYTRNVDVVSYENGVKELHNEEGRVIASALYDYYSNGCSIRVLNPQTYDQKVHLLIATLQEYFGTMVGANVYLTPPGSQGFAPHYDDIEAFIIQLEGRKHWKLYKPKGSDILARDSSPNLKHEDIGKPFMEVTLNAGDLLYFPRGTMHEGRTDPDSHSFHITVSVYQHTSYVDLLEHILPEALKRAANEDIEYRQGLPINYLKHLGHVNKNCTSKERSVIVDKVDKLIQNLKNYVNLDLAADKLGRKFMYDSMPPVLSKREVKLTSKYDGDYMKDGKVLNRVEIGLDTQIRLLRYHCLRMVVENDVPKIYYNTDNSKIYHGEEEQFLVIDNQLIPCIEKLQNSYPEFLEVEQLPIEDNIAKAQLVSDLWEKGLLVTDGPLPCFSEEGVEDSCENSF